MRRMTMLVGVLCAALVLASSVWAAGTQRVEIQNQLLNVTADTLVKSGGGWLHSITCSSDTAATAGSIIVYDNTTESGTVLWTWQVQLALYNPFTVTLDGFFNTGLYVGYTTTNDVTCTVSYR